MNKLDTLEPFFKTQIEGLINAVEVTTGLKWTCTAGRRTMAEQEALYEQGRTKPGKIVTKAPPGSSAHNYGLAVDLWPLVDGEINWQASPAIFKPLADLALAIGLTAGYYFRSFQDSPHIEHPSWREQQKSWILGEVEIA